MENIEYKRGKFTIIVNGKKENTKENNKNNNESYNNIEIDRSDLYGKVIVFTGRGPYSRSQLFKMARESGCIISTNIITKHTDILIVGEKPGSKLQKAKLLGIRTISVQEFLKAIDA